MSRDGKLAPWQGSSSKSLTPQLVLCISPSRHLLLTCCLILLSVFDSSQSLLGQAHFSQAWTKGTPEARQEGVVGGHTPNQQV